MTAPPIKDTTGRPPKELAGATADSPLATGGDLFAQLSTHWLIYPIPLAHTGAVIQSFPPFIEGSAVTPDLGPVNLLQTHDRTILEGVSGAISVEPTPADFDTRQFAIGCSSASAEPTWRFHARIGHRDATTGNRMFVGLCDATHDPTIEAASYLGIRARDTDTNYQFAYSDGTTETFVDLGVPVAFWTLVDGDLSAVMPVQLFDLFIGSVKGATGFVWRVLDVLSGAPVGSGTVTTNIPDAITPLRYFGKARGQIISDLLDQWKQGNELIPIVQVFYADFPYGPFGVDNRGGYAAPPTGGGGGGPDAFLPWHEPFDHADYAALVDYYNAGGGAANFPNDGDDGHGGVVTDYISVTGGAIEIKGDTDFWTLDFGPPLFTTPVFEWWAKIEFEVVGGDYDSPNDVVTFSARDVAGNIETDVTTFGLSNPSHFQLIELFNDTITGASAVSTFPRFLPAGSYTFIICCSEDDSVTQRSELWINAAAGDAADAVCTITKISGTGFSIFDFGMDGPTDTARTLRHTDLSVVPGDRASDPFGIL